MSHSFRSGSGPDGASGMRLHSRSMGVGVDVSGRPLALREVDLDRFFRPKAVAVVGASDTEGKPNTISTAHLKRWADRVGATLYPVNPGRETVFGLPCFP